MIWIVAIINVTCCLNLFLFIHLWAFKLASRLLLLWPFLWLQCACVWSSWAEPHYSLLQHPLRRQMQTQMQHMRTNATNAAAPDIRIVILSGSRRTWRSRHWLLIGWWSMTSQHQWRVALTCLQSTTFNCWATQLLGAPTLLEDSQRYIPESVLDTLFNFCSKQRCRD